MKRVFFFLFVAMISSNLFSQESVDDAKLKGWALLWTKIYNLSSDIATTESEYNYAVNGIPTSITNSLDLKSGYKIEGYKTLEEYNSGGYNYSSGVYSFRFDNLLRVKDNTIACVLVKIHSGETNKIYHRCIPIANAELTEKFSSDFQNWSVSMQKAYSQALMQYSMGSVIILNGILNKVLNSPESNEILKGFGLTPEEIGYVNLMKN